MTTMRATRRFAFGFFAAYAIAVIYPVVVPLRGPRPFVFGMPFAVVWAAAWIVAAFFVLLLLDRSYSAAETISRAGEGAHDAAGSARPAAGADDDDSRGNPFPPPATPGC